MTFVIESYHDNGRYGAFIEQEKGSRLFDVQVIRFLYDGSETVDYKNSFDTLKNARRAIRRNYPGMIRED